MRNQFVIGNGNSVQAYQVLYNTRIKKTFRLLPHDGNLALAVTVPSA